MSGDHDVCPNCGAEAMWCDCDPDKKVERDAYIRGAKDALAELMRRWNSGQLRLRAHEALIKEIKRGEWPPKEDSCQT